MASRMIQCIIWIRIMPPAARAEERGASVFMSTGLRPRLFFLTPVGVHRFLIILQENGGHGPPYERLISNIFRFYFLQSIGCRSD